MCVRVRYAWLVSSWAVVLAVACAPWGEGVGPAVRGNERWGGVGGRVSAMAVAARAEHTATLLPTGQVLVVGGSNSTVELASAELYDPVTGTWSTTGSLEQARSRHTATLLPNGRVLVVGGGRGSAARQSAELYDPATGTWSTTGSLEQARSRHTATLLPTGQVLVVGGEGASGTALASAELYDPATGTWSSAGGLAGARLDHTATLLASGRVLVTGGAATFNLGTSELYNPATGAWSTTGSLAQARSRHTATLLPGGEVLVVGGAGTLSRLSSAELYNPAAGTWSAAEAMSSARSDHSATLLPNGQVLVAGGYTAADLSSTLLYNPATGRWSAAQALAQARSQHTATLLAHGHVLLCGGFQGSSALASSEQYELPTGTWRATGSLPGGRSGHVATLLAKGQVLVAGGANGTSPLPGAVLYEPASGTWSATAPLAEPRQGHTATLLPTGQVLVAGGSGPSEPLGSAELYDPSTARWSRAGALSTPRSGHTATLLANGQVLVAGGSGPSGELASAELYDPATGTWSSAGALSAVRSGHTATLLANGRVLVAGGRQGSNLLASAELYDPATGTWSAASALSAARSAHSATLLPGGSVLVAGGSSASGELLSAELYEPATGRWSQAGPMGAARAGHSATLLPGGQVLLAGSSDSSASTSAELYELAGAQPGWYPQPNDPGPLAVGGNFTLSGTRFRGLSEAHGGGTQSSASNVPLPTLRSLEGREWLLPLRGFSDTSLTCALPLVRNGYYLLLVSTNALARGLVVEVRSPTPETLLLSTPPELAASSSATFSLGSPGTNIAGYECSLDGEAFTPCPATATFSSLIEGPHTLLARARDTAGNEDPTPVSFAWSVDTLAPSLGLASTPPQVTSASSVSFVLESPAEDLSSYECSLVGLAFGPCSNPVTYTGLAEGEYTFTAIARDRAGNESTPVSFSFRVDLTAPRLTLISTPRPASSSTSATFELSTDEEGAGFKCSLDGLAYETCPSSTLYTGLAEGEHTFGAIARDEAGNESELASFTWRVDTRPPEPPQVEQPAPRQVLQGGAVRASGTAEPGSTLTLFINGEAAGTAEVAEEGTWALEPEGRLPPGSYALSAAATDAAGNTSELSEEVAFDMDTRSLYGWGCSSAPRAEGAWGLALLGLAWGLWRSRRPSHPVRARPTALPVLLALGLLLQAGSGEAAPRRRQRTPCPKTKNPYTCRVARLYDALEYEAALKVLDKAWSRVGQGARERRWLELMRGVLHFSLGHAQPSDEAFLKVLSEDARVQLPVLTPARSLHEHFEQLRQQVVQARQQAELPRVEPAAPAPEPREPDPLPPVQVVPEPQVERPVAPEPLPTPPPAAAAMAPSPPAGPAWSLDFGVRGEAELLRRSAVPSVLLEVLGRPQQGQAGPRAGLLAQAIIQPEPLLRAEGRLYPVDVWLGDSSLLHCYALAGATLHLATRAAGARVGVGLGMQWGRLRLSTDVAYERFLTAPVGRQPEALLLSVGTTWSPSGPH